MEEKKREFIVTINGLPCKVDQSGTMAITPDGKAIRLEDRKISKSRFK